MNWRMKILAMCSEAQAKHVEDVLFLRRASKITFSRRDTDHILICATVPSLKLAGEVVGKIEDQNPLQIELTPTS